MKTFNLELAKAGAPVVTQDGRKDYPLVGAILQEQNVEHKPTYLSLK